MTIIFNACGEQRKVLVSAISEFTNTKAHYMKMPTQAYEIGKFTVDKAGNLNFDDDIDFEDLLKYVAQKGFAPQGTEDATEEQVESSVNIAEEGNIAPQSENVGLTVAMPIDYFTDDSIINLQRIISLKYNLICKALGIESLPIEIDEEKVSFPWFEIAPTDSETVNAYTHFIYSLCEMARNQKRINAKEKDVQNEKYAFRCFLLRLGFIGEKYKCERKILLKNLKGSSAFKEVSKNNFPNQNMVEHIRKMYPVGTRVRLLKMEDPQAPPIGTLGTVTGVDDIASIMVKWDTGCGLHLAYGEDICEKVGDVDE